MPSNQKKIRDLERLLKKKSLQQKNDTDDPSNEIVQNQIISKIDEVKKNKYEIMNKEKERKNATKYHMVKFLERKKITRMIKTIETKLLNMDCSNLEDRNKTSLLNKKEKLMEELAYIMYYPNELKYIALFPVKTNINNDFDESSQKSKKISTKARTIALGRWNEDKYDSSDKIDKVAYAMEVAYNGKNRDIVNKQLDNTLPSNKNEYSYNNNKDDNKAYSTNKDCEQCDENMYVSKSKKKTTKKDKININTSNTIKSTTIDSQLSHITNIELTDDDFLIEETSLSITTINNYNTTTTNKVNLQANDGKSNGSNRYNQRQDRSSIHEIRFAATKRKFENHQRVFKNQQLRTNNNYKKH